ncbi:MAG: LuxR C-terminal-related transcriptional regulator, partial [Bacteroidota bacterium]
KKWDGRNFSNSEMQRSQESMILETYLDRNRFMTIFDLSQNEFAFTRSVHKVLGIKDEEFTLKKLLSIIPPFQLILTLHYGKTALELLASGHKFQALDQVYTVYFPIYDPDSVEKAPKRIRRKCALFQFKGKVPLNILEFWENVSFEDQMDHVKWTMGGSTEEEAIELCASFYEIWKRKLGISYSDRELQALVLSQEGATNKRIALQMEVKENTVEDYFKNMKKKVKRVVHRFNSDLNFNMGISPRLDPPDYLNRRELLRYSHQLGLLPDNILKQTFRQAS